MTADIASFAHRADAMGRSIREIESLSDQVRGFLLAEITSGRMRPGDRINEADLARRLGISRNPVREAISGLVQKGYLIAQPRRGTVLRSFTAQDARDVFSFRTCVETFALRQMFDVTTTEERAVFRGFVEGMVTAAATGDVALSQDCDLRFHREICRLSGNRLTLQAHEGIDTEMRMLIAAVDLEAETLEENVTAHRPIAEAIAEGRRTEAHDLLSAHIATTERFVLATFA